ncbi:hypothetical protein [Desulfitibacter alkalitolerans]|uniref:hypothetical protein n=1 Tax=Desulfitibacter alkalitolerans TaxID=264641 RepID=UPI0004837198|nr:hypothetical protein [Desulfitibacter alkalitolerans]
MRILNEKRLRKLGIVALVFTLFIAGAWLVNQRAAYAEGDFRDLSFGKLLNNTPSFGGGCCSGTDNSRQRSCGMNPGGGCGSGTSFAQKDLTAIEAEAETYYKDRYGDTEIEVKVTDYGCHIQADIFKEGQLVISYGYAGNGEFYEIPTRGL